MKIPTAKYLKFKDNIRTGDLILCVGRGFVSGVIKSVEYDRCPPIVINSKRKYFTHIGVLVKVGRHIFVCEANGETGKVEFYRFSRQYRSYDGEVYLVRPKFKEDGGMKFTAQEFADRCLDAEGNKYDFTDLFTQYWNHLKGIIVLNGGPDIKRKPHIEDHEFYCSEIINLAAGYLFGAKDEWTTPHDCGYQLRDRILVRLKEIKENA